MNWKACFGSDRVVNAVLEYSVGEMFLNAKRFRRCSHPRNKIVSGMITIESILKICTRTVEPALEDTLQIQLGRQS